MSLSNRVGPRSNIEIDAIFEDMATEITENRFRPPCCHLIHAGMRPWYDG